MNKEMKVLSDANQLIEAFNRTKKESIWKESVQKYEANLLRNTYLLKTSLRDGTYKQRAFYEFTLNERGKTRYVKSMHITDRVVQRSLCDNILIPRLQHYLIYDNGASLKNKGIDFSRKRLETHLHRFYRKNGSNEGYVLLIDYSKFFDNIRHDKMVELLEKNIDSPEFIAFVRQLLKTFSIDVSYLSDEEYKTCLNQLYNSLEHSKIDPSLLVGEKMMEKSVGIGSQISQICGIYYPTRVDNYCKIVKGMKYYGRYMDDVYVIHKDKEVLKQLLKEVDDLSKELGLFINQKKTQIVKLKHGFTFLKIKYNLTESGRVLKRLVPKTITRERRRLKKYKKLMEEGKMSYKDIELAYKSWRGNALRYHAYTSVKHLDALFDQLYIKEWKGKNKDELIV